MTPLKSFSIRLAVVLAVLALPGCAVRSGPTLATLGLSGELPGAEQFPRPLDHELASSWAARPGDYTPQTKHIGQDGTPLYINRLFLDASPYLRQHAHNPVN